MFEKGNGLLFISSFVAWATACIVDSVILQGVQPFLIVAYILQLLLWVLALRDGTRFIMRRLILVLGVVLAIGLSLIPNVILAPITLILWVSLSPFFFSKRHCWLLYAVANSVFVCAVVFVKPDGLITAVSFVAFQLFSLSSSFLRLDLSDKTTALEAANSKLRSAQGLLAGQSKAQERDRISQDLHDNIGQRLTALSLSCEFALHKPPESYPDQLKQLKADISESLTELRSVVMRLKQKDPLGLAERLQVLATKVPNVHLVLDLSETINDDGLSEHLTYCLQEGLNNAVRHGRATELKVVSACCGQKIVFSMRDNGTIRESALTPNSGLGLSGMRERLAVYDGEVSLDIHAEFALLRLTVPLSYRSV
ncbi:MAG: signal transduction histidine kinase [Flavobacteriales bacterium]|jgi:signal transduction histidine kinase